MSHLTQGTTLRYPPENRSLNYCAVQVEMSRTDAGGDDVRVARCVSLALVTRVTHALYCSVHADGTFIFEGVIPGKHHLRVLKDSWCWKETRKEVAVAYTDVEVHRA